MLKTILFMKAYQQTITEETLERQTSELLKKKLLSFSLNFFSFSSLSLSHSLSDHDFNMIVARQLEHLQKNGETSIPSKHAGSDSHRGRIGWEALARSGPDPFGQNLAHSARTKPDPFGQNLAHSARTITDPGWFFTVLSRTSGEERNRV